MEDVLHVALIHEDPDFLVVDKPSGLPTVPLKDDPKEKATLLSLVGRMYPEVLSVEGANAWEGGVLHRLDTATSGLVVIARNRQVYASLQAIGKAELFLKEYRAQSSHHQEPLLPGFPPYPYEDPVACGGREVSVGSLFRRYGENRSQVRPVVAGSPKHLLDKTSGTWYLTRVGYSGREGKDTHLFTCRLTSGFRHQVRVHMAWSGWPLDGDTVYQGKAADRLGLRAVAVEFPHPTTGRPFEIRLEQ